MDKIERIRKRASYQEFKRLYNFLSSLQLKKKISVKILRRFYDLLEGRWSFGSEANSNYAEESLNQLCNDILKCNQ